MNEIKRIGISGVGPFKKKQILDVPKGIVYLYGKNFKRDHGNGNAAGKSLFGASVAEIFYDTPIVGTKQDKSKKGSRFVEFIRNKKRIRVTSTFTGKTEKISVHVDGEDKSGRTNKNTRELLEKYWPINEKEYRTYGHIDASKVHHLVGGSSLERKAFFTEFFGLDKLDAEKKLIGAEISKLKKVNAARAELQRAFDDVKRDMLSKSDRVQKEAEVELLSKKVRKLRAAYTEHASIMQLVEFERFAGDKLKKLNALVPDLSSFDDIVAKTKKELKIAEQSQERYQEWRSYKKDLERYCRAVEGVDLKTDLKELERLSNDYLRAKARLEDASSNERPKELKKPKKPESDKDAAIASRVSLRHSIEHARKFHTGKCHTCGQDVKAEDPKRIKAKLERAEAIISEWDDYESKVKKYERNKEQIAVWDKEQDTIARARSVVKKNRDAHELYRKRQSLPERPSKVEKPDSSVEEVTPIQQRYDLLQFFEPQIEIVKALSKLTKADRVKTFDSELLGNVQERLAKITAQLEVHRSVKNRAGKLKDRLGQLDEQMEDQKALELLYEGYNDKAVKRMVVEAINTHLMTAVNQYSGIAFEDYRFEFIWGTQVQLLVHRPGMDSTDVRKLSGAESTLFTMVLLMALLKFVPSHKRLSMIILDEPCASFSEETTDLFHQLLTHLNKLIPTILIITPDARVRLEGAIEMTVVRDDNGARIVQGHPNEISK